jgi:hypothetical protein
MEAKDILNRELQTWLLACHCVIFEGVQSTRVLAFADSFFAPGRLPLPLSSLKNELLSYGDL